ncbi:MAG: xylulokinase [Phycisphaerales bacterium]|nr:xylulokinase [Phycisphaerales bacterium]
MTDRPHVLGIDIGTSGARVLVVDHASGEVIRTATSEYGSISPHAGWSEQQPRDWWSGCCSAIRQALAGSEISGESIAAIGLSGQMHGLVLMDDNDSVLRPAILWNDQRTADECELMHETIGLQRLIEITGKPAMTGFTAPKILWVKRHEPKIYARSRHVLLPKDYVRWCLSGVHSIDVADASGTSLLDLEQRDWSNELVSGLDLDAQWLPPVAESVDVTAEVSRSAAAETGLRPGTPIVAGAGDQAAGGIGCGIGDESVISLNLGTSGVVFAARDARPHDPSGALHAYCHAMPGTWHVMGVMLSAGGSLRWYRDTFEGAEASAYDRIIQGARGVSPGCDGLSFLPYLTGERTPHADPHARGAFTGISNQHERGHFARAVLEGVLFGLRDGLDLVQADGQAVDRIRMTGGGARSDFWRQMAADVFDLPIYTVNVTDGSAYGAALLALVGSGHFPDITEAMKTCVRETGETTPSPDARVYGDIHAAWRDLYPALAPTFTRHDDS